MENPKRIEYPIFKEYLNSMPPPIEDEVSATVTYKGYAPLGTRITDAKWHIQRITKANAVIPQGVIITEFAGGSDKFEFVWANRTALSYSR